MFPHACSTERRFSMIETNFQEWEEYDSRLPDDLPVGRELLAAPQAGIQPPPVGVESASIIHGPFLLSKVAEVFPRAEWQALAPGVTPPTKTSSRALTGGAELRPNGCGCGHQSGDITPRINISETEKTSSVPLVGEMARMTTAAKPARSRYAKWSDADDRARRRNPRDQVIAGHPRTEKNVLIYPPAAGRNERIFLLKNFKIDGASLRGDHRAYLADLANWMARGGGRWRVVVEARASRTGASRHDDVLSEDRYLATRAFLEVELQKHGVDIARVRISGEGVGFRHTRLPGEDPRARSVYAVVQPDPSPFPPQPWKPPGLAINWLIIIPPPLLLPAAWRPPIRAEELGANGTDKLGSRTFNFGKFSVFVPAGLGSDTANRVHVFFSPGCVSGPSGGNAVAVHGLRGAADKGNWILIGVPGVLKSPYHTITDSEIVDCLQAVGRAAQVDAVRLSAHSRGAGGLAETLQPKRITPSLIDQITLLDTTDFASGLMQGFQTSNISLAKVKAYNVVFGDFPLIGKQNNFRVPFNGIRSIGYARLILDGLATGRANSPLPPDIDKRIKALKLPSRGNFSKITPLPAGKTSLSAFCSDPANQSVLADMRFGEPSDPTSFLAPAEVTKLAATSPYAFIEENNVMGLNSPAIPRAQWLRFNPQIYAHHLFVAEIAHEVFG
jgi:hypothetical protein